MSGAWLCPNLILRTFAARTCFVLGLLIALAGCTDRQMADLRQKLRGSVSRAGNPIGSPQTAQREEGRREDARARLLGEPDSRSKGDRRRQLSLDDEEESGDRHPADDEEESELAESDKRSSGKHGRAAGSGRGKGRDNGFREPGEEDDEPAETDADPTKSVGGPAALAKGADGKTPVKVEGPIKTCPQNGKIVGAPPPKGNSVWCERPGANGKIVRDGPYFKFHSNGQKAIQGSFVDGKANGLFLFWLPDGNKVEEKGYRNGQLHGAYVKYGKDNQKVLEGRYALGKKNGEFAFYGKGGRLKQKGSFRDNIKDGVWTTYNRDGQPRNKFTFKAGKKNGKAELYYSNGQLRAQGSYKENEQHGVWVNFFQEGNPKAQGAFVDGEKNGPWSFFRRDGQLTKVVYYQNGRAIRTDGYQRRGGRNGRSRERRSRRGDAGPPVAEPEEGWRPL